VRQVKAKLRAYLSFSLTSRGLFGKNSSWQAKQLIPHITVMFYADCTKIFKDFAPNFRDKISGSYITKTHRLTLLFHQGFLTKNNMTLVPHPPYFTLFHRLKIKLKGRHFDITDVMEAESQEVLNTLAEQDFQDAFKKRQHSGNDSYARKGTTSRVMVASRSKVSFRTDGSTSPENYGWLFVM
jgi:hypothetical protein